MLSTFATAVLALLAVSSPVAALAPGHTAQDLSARSLEARGVSKGTLGSVCRFHSQCKEAPTGAHASCNKKGRCDFVCLNAPILVKNAAGNGCIPNPKLNSVCNTDSQCKSKVKGLPSQSHEICLYGQCAYACNDGYHKIAGKCYKNMDVCSGVTCASVENGVSFCGSKGQCIYRCNQAGGFTLYTNAKKNAYKCMNTGKDADNCGTIGNVCAGGYNGIGSPICLSGTCSVDCTGHGQRLFKNGKYYCSRR